MHYPGQSFRPPDPGVSCGKLPGIRRNLREIARKYPDLEAGFRTGIYRIFSRGFLVNPVISGPIQPEITGKSTTNSVSEYCFQEIGRNATEPAVSAPDFWTWDSALNRLLFYRFKNGFSFFHLKYSATVCISKRSHCDWRKYYKRIESFTQNPNIKFGTIFLFYKLDP